MMETWCPVPGHPLLEASSQGRVRSLPYETAMPKGGVKINQLAATSGVHGRASKGAAYTRRQITFRRKTLKVATLVCLAFNGPPPPGRANVLHRDEDSDNNRPGNLVWGTQKENLTAPGFVAYCKGRTGENSPTSKSRRA